MPVYEAYQDAVGGRDESVLNTLLLEIRRHLSDPEIRPEGDWCGVHYVFDMALRIGVQRLGRYESQHDTMSIYDDQRLDFAPADAFPRLSDSVL